MMDDKTQEPLWLTKASQAKQALRAVAGDAFVLKAADLIPYEGEDRAIEWTVAGKMLRGPVLKWTPRSPGFYRVELRVGRRRVRRIVTVGLRPADLVTRPQDFDSYFCFIVPNGHKVHFFPLLPKSAPAQNGREGLQRELEERHPAFARLMAAHTRIYRNRVLPHPFVDPKSFRPGLYAICANDTCYLGSERRLHSIAGKLQQHVRTLAERKTGRGVVLQAIEETLAKVTPADYEYSSEVHFPIASLQRRGAFASERFACGVISSVVAATLNFARDIGTASGRPSDGLTTMVTFNSANGALSTSLFDSVQRLTRQVMSAFETERGIGFLGDLGALEGFGIDLGGGGRAGLDGDLGIDLGLGDFGRGIDTGFTDWFGGGAEGGEGFGPGVSPFSRLGGQTAAAQPKPNTTK